jgi:hypothetical protein
MPCWPTPPSACALALRLRKIPVAKAFKTSSPAAATSPEGDPHPPVGQESFCWWSRCCFRTSWAPAPSAAVIAAFFCFSFMASANYLVNDMLDIESDRRHPAKRLRPLPPAICRSPAALVLVLVLVAASAAILPWLPSRIRAMAGEFISSPRRPIPSISSAIALVDVLMLSGLYTLRLLAGGAATGTEISHWLAGFSIFCFSRWPWSSASASWRTCASGASPRPTDAAIWSTTSSRFAASAPPAPRPPWWFFRFTSPAPDVRRSTGTQAGCG